MLEGGRYGTIDELAAEEKINSSYVSCLVRLTLLAPHIVDRILDGGHYADLTLSKIMEPIPLIWTSKRPHFKRSSTIGFGRTKKSTATRRTSQIALFHSLNGHTTVRANPETNFCFSPVALGAPCTVRTWAKDRDALVAIGFGRSLCGNGGEPVLRI